MKAQGRRARSVVDVMLGEATYGTTAERWADLVAIASVIENRARQLGVSPEDVVASTQEFNAYNKALPAGVEKHRALARAALDFVKQNGPVHNATFYAAPDAVGGLPRGLQPVTQTTGHAYFSDPHNRSIKTAKGYVSPRTSSLPSSPPTPTARPSMVADINPERWGARPNAANINPERWGSVPSAPSYSVDNVNPARWGGNVPSAASVNPERWGTPPAAPSISAAPKTSPQNWDAGPASPFDFSKIDMGRMLSNTVTRGTGWAPAPSTLAEQAARTAAAAANNTSLDSEFSDMLTGLDNRAFAAIQGNELQIGKTVAPETQFASAPPTPTVNATLAGGLSPGWGMQADIDFSPTTDETLSAYGPEDEVAAPPSRFERLRTVARPAVRNAMLGMKFAGLPGAAIGALAGLVPDSWRPDFGPTFDAAVPASERFSTGFGLPGITAAMGGPRGAQGFSASNPGMSYTSLGNGQGIRRSEKYGWSEVVGPDGSVRGISYDNPGTKGLLGDISRAMNERFGGGMAKAEKAAEKAERNTERGDRSKFGGRTGGAGSGSHGRGGGRFN